MRLLTVTTALSFVSVALSQVAEEVETSSTIVPRSYYPAKHYPFNPALFAHGLLASMAFVILMPAGAIGIRILSIPGMWAIHGAIMALAYVIYIAAFGIGVHLAMGWGYLTDKHSILGIIIFVLVFPQPFTGWLHHRFFLKTFSRTAWSYFHIWLGRIIVTLGIINGGFGLQLAGNSNSGNIAYSVIGGVIWVVYVACAIWGEMKKAKQNKARGESNASSFGNTTIAAQRTHESISVDGSTEKVADV